MQLYINYIGKNKAWDLASLPSSIHNFKMNLIWCPRSHKISPLSFQQHCIFLSMFLTQLSVDVFFTKLQHSGGRSVCTAAAPHNTPQNTSCVWPAGFGHVLPIETKNYYSRDQGKIRFSNWTERLHASGFDSSRGAIWGLEQDLYFIW